MTYPKQLNKTLEQVLFHDLPIPVMQSTELQSQIAYINWLRLKMIEARNLSATGVANLSKLQLTVHTPNEGKRTVIGGANLKRAGMLPGFPDIANHAFRFAFELKAGKNFVTPHQIWWLRSLELEGYFVAVCYSAQEAEDFTEATMATWAQSEVHDSIGNQRWRRIFEWATRDVQERIVDPWVMNSHKSAW